MSTLKLNVAEIDFVDKLRAARTERINAVYIPVFASSVFQAIEKIEPDCKCFDSFAIGNGDTMFSAEKMFEYAKVTEGTPIVSDYAYVFLCHQDQDVINECVRMVADASSLDVVE